MSKELFGHLQKIDSIYVNADDFQHIDEYVFSIPKEDRELQNHILNEGLLVIQDRNEITKIHFNIEDYEIKYKVYHQDTENQSINQILEVKLDTLTNKVDVVKVHQAFEKVGEENINKMCNTYSYWITVVLLYMGNCKSEDAFVEEKERVSVPTKNRHKSKQKNKFTYITKKKYTIKAPSEEKKREIQRHTESWTVRGHSRVYKKTGKEVWVKPHIKGHGVVTPKNYKITP